MPEPKRKQFADAVSNGDFICILTCSGYYWSCQPDPLGKNHLLAADATDDTVGVALLDALAHSRFLPPTEHKAFYDPQANKQRYEDRVADLMRRYGYKTRRAMFSAMDSCGIELVDGQIVIQPRNHVKTEVWDRKKGDNARDVIILANSSPAEVGAALRAGFLRCT